jgi:hypothetical protein
MLPDGKQERHSHGFRVSKCLPVPSLYKGQGLRSSPQIWTMISGLLMKVLNNEANEAHYELTKYIMLGVTSRGYMDNINTHHNTSPTEQRELTTSMTADN